MRAAIVAACVSADVQTGQAHVVGLGGNAGRVFGRTRLERNAELRMLNTSEQELSERANAIGKAISATGLKVGISPDTTECGGAVLPGVLLPTWTVQVEHEKVKEDQLYDALLARGIIARRAPGRGHFGSREVSFQRRNQECSTR